MAVRGRPNPLAEPEFARQVAAAFVEGMSRQEMADAFGVKDLDTITRWRRDPRVQQLALKLTRDRILQVTRKVDSKIEYILQTEDLKVADLIAIRKEFLGGVIRDQSEQMDDTTLSEAQDLLEDNPSFVEEFEELIARSKAAKKE